LRQASVSIAVGLCLVAETRPRVTKTSSPGSAPRRHRTITVAIVRLIDHVLVVNLQLLTAA
jgi:hypothetical protein